MRMTHSSRPFDVSMALAHPFIPSALTPFLHLLEAALDHVATQRREAVNEEKAVAVIRLMQEAARGQALGLLLVNFSANVLSAEAHARGARQGRVYLADREAGFFALLLALGGEDFGVGGDELQPHAVHHEEAQG